VRKAQALAQRTNSQPRTTAIADGQSITIRVEHVPAVQAPDELLTIDSCGLDDATARRLIKDGTRPAARIGRRLYVRRSDVLALVDRLAVTSKPALRGDPESDYAELVRSAKRRAS
jgi:hypothetical protein